MRAGIIADDFTGATDIASFLANNGIATSLFSGVPGEDYQGDARALVVSLKSRSVPAEESVTLSLTRWTGCNNRGAIAFILSTAPPSIARERGISARSPMP